MQPDTLLERFNAKKSSGIGATKDFLSIKGTKGQVENVTQKAKTLNDRLGFKCLHYSVTESSGFVEITVLKKQHGTEESFGIRTVENTAKHGTEFEQFNKVIEMKK